MPNLTTIPNEILDEIAFYLDPQATSHLQLISRSLYCNLAPAMHRHAIASKDGMPALHWAAENGHFPLVQHLLPLFPVDHANTSGYAAFQATSQASNNPPTPTDPLLDGAGIDHPDDRGLTALHYACANPMSANAEDIIRLLISHGANVNIECLNRSAVPLSIAIEAGFKDIICVLFEAGANVHWVSIDGKPLVHYPVWIRDMESFELLLGYGADMESCDRFRRTSLLLAVRYGGLAIVKMLVGRGADVRRVDSEGDNPLTMALRGHHTDIAEYLVRLEGMDITSDNLGYTPFNMAAAAGLDPLLKILHELGAPIDYANELGVTALHMAIFNGQVTTMKLLLEWGANIENVTNSGDTPLLAAIEYQDLEMVEILIAEGADITTCGLGSVPPLSIACLSGNEEIVGLLLAKGADVNPVDEEGQTAMDWAVVYGYHGVIAILAAHIGDCHGN